MVFQGSKRSSNISNQESCIPTKQALWMEKKKKKLERKKKLSTRNKIQFNEQQVELVENELSLIASFLDLSNTFLKDFFKINWKAVVSQLEANAFRSFEECLEIIIDCLHWFRFLSVSKELKKDFVRNKKRLEISQSVFEVLSDSFGLLHQYIFRCSQIKSLVLFDHRFYFDCERHLRLPLATGDQVVDKYVDEETYFTRISICGAFKNGTTPHWLDVAIDREFITKCEWKLKLNYRRLWKMRDTCVQLVNCGRFFDLVLDNINESANFNTNHKTLTVVDDFFIWSEWQWTFLDGWMFSFDHLCYNFNWLNKFNIRSLKYYTSYLRMIFFLKNWILYSTEAVFTNKHCSPKSQLLWNVNGFDLIDSKTASLKVLFQERKGWYFGLMWISKEPCNPWQPFCENSCCIGWDSSNLRNNSIVQESLSLQNAFKGKTLKKCVSKQKRDEVKIKKYSSKLSANKSSGLNQIINEKINLPEEKQQSLCILQ